MAEAELLPGAPSGFVENVIMLMELRDCIHDELRVRDNLPVLERPFSVYKKWITNNGQSHPVVRRLDISRKFPDLYKPYVSQVFRYGQVLKPFSDRAAGSLPNSGAVDSRTWDLFRFWRFSGPMVQCDFVAKEDARQTSLGVSREEPGHNTAKPLYWATSKSTAFEKCVFLATQAMLGNCKRNYASSGVPAGKRKKASKRCSSHRNSRAHAQRLGYAVQTVIRGWNLLAEALKFAHAEDMLLPYIFFNWSEGMYEVLPSGAGYTPKEQRNRYASGQEPTLDIDASAVLALHREGEFDLTLRRLAQVFLSDLTNHFTSEVLYVQEDKEWDVARSYARRDRALPERFDALQGLIQSAAQYLGLHTETVDRRAPGGGVEIAPEPLPSMSEKLPAGAAAPRQAPRLSSGCPDSCACLGARMTMRAYMKLYLRLHQVSFQDLVTESMAFSPDGALPIVGNVQCVISDPPFNFRRERGRAHSFYDMLSVDDMWNVADVCMELLRPGGHVILFCSAEQFAQWVACFEAAEDPALDSRKATKAFLVDRHDFTFVNQPGVFTSFPGRRHTALQSVTAKAFHAVRAGASRDESLEMVRYTCFNFVPSRFPGYCNIIDNSPGLSPGEALFYEKNDEEGSRRVRPEQKSIDLLRELVSRFSKPGDIVVDLFGGTFATAVACFSIPDEKMRTFVGCELDERCFYAARMWVENKFAEQLLENKERRSVFPTAPPAAVTESARLMLSHVRRSSRAVSTSSWTAPAHLPSMSILPGYIMDHLAALWRDPRFSRRYRDQPLESWPRKLQAMLHSVNTEQLQAVEATHRGLYISRSLIRNETVGDGLFANKTFQANDLVVPYYGMLVYTDLSKTESSFRLYRKGCLGVSPEQFRNSAIRLSLSEDPDFNRNVARQSGINQVFIVPFASCLGAKINDVRYGPGDQDRFSETNRRVANVRFVQSRQAFLPSKTSHLTETDAIRVVACRDIKPDDELYVDYGNKHVIT